MGGSAAVVVVLLATGSVPTASAQAALADWLSRAAVHVDDIHKAENAAYAVIKAPGKIDVDKLRTDCGQLRDANTALSNVMPTPDPKLTVEVQQAIDNFDSGWQSCIAYVTFHKVDRLNDFWSLLQTAEQHLSSADTILVALAQAG